MIPRTCTAALLTLGLLLPLGGEAATPTQHNIDASLVPAEGRLRVQDTVTLPPGSPNEMRFFLDAGLKVESLTSGSTVEREATQGSVAIYRLKLPKDRLQFTLAYEGVIRRAPQQEKEEARQFQTTPGIISNEGVFLEGASHWYPQFVNDGDLVFTLTVKVPEGWEAISQGKRSGRMDLPPHTLVTWRSDSPQQEIYLIAGQYTEYSAPADTTTAQVFLRTPDEALANRYLDATKKYLAFYEGLLGPYPYPKFAMVENFWETGYGMPSFTLLGSQVIRFPFILESSYPHEILHNWWGNGVYVDYETGNWSEGLTSYLADHLLQERQGKGADYRRTTLQKYTDFASASRDFPLTEFRSRYSSASEAVGYGKTLMMMHMLRRELGDATFVQGLRRFYFDNRFRRAGFSELARAFSETTGRDMQTWFDQWVKRVGAPRLKLSDVSAKSIGAKFALSARLQQVQEGEAYRIKVPVVITLEGEPKAYQTTVDMRGANQVIEMKFSKRPLRIDIDPEFDLFRRLDANEIPPAMSMAFGAEQALIVLPSQAPAARLAAYRKAAESWQQNPNIRTEIVMDDALTQLPGDKAVWIVGWENRFLGSVGTPIMSLEGGLDDKTLVLGGKTYAREGTAAALNLRNPQNPAVALGWLGADEPAAIPGLFRKLPHYSQSSYAVFTGSEPKNIAKGLWTVVDSPLTATVYPNDARPLRPPLEERKALEIPKSSGN